MTEAAYTAAAAQPDARTSATDRSLVDWAVLVFSTFFILIHLYGAIYSAPDALLYRSLHVTTALVLVFLTKPLPGLWRWLDILFIAGVIWVQIYFFIELETWNIRTVFFRPIDYVTSILFIVTILEATRRVVGFILALVALFFMFHAVFANHFPGIFYGPPSSLKNLLQNVFLDSNGIFGTAIAVMANFVVLFILFGTMLNACGGGAFFTRLAFALFAHRTGGPAKAAVVSSAMMGSLSGSAIGNVLTTGVFTIPLMIRLGYRRAFAGGVEAAASNGGMIMPPVMGAVAFIMAEFLDRPYSEIVIAAIIPAFLYFLVIFVTVHAEARKLGLATIDRQHLPSPLRILRAQGYLLLPILLIIGALIAGRSIVYVAVLITAATFLIALVQPRNRITPGALLGVVEATARATVGLSAAAAAAGIVLGAIFAVGLSFQIAQAAAAAAADNLWVLLLLSAVMALIMGMGMTAIAIYLTLVATIIPILKLAGVPPVAAHFFAFYYGIISNITPPVALAAFAAAPIATANPIGVGVQASRLGVSCFLLPIFFIYAPGILFEGTAVEIIAATVTATVGLVAFALGVTGHALNPMPGWQRLSALLAAGLCVAPLAETQLAGIVLAGAVLAANALRRYAAPADRRPDLGRARARNGQPANGQSRESAAGIVANDAREAEEATETRDILDAVMAEPPVDPDRTKGLWAGWAIVILVAAAMELCGQLALHARTPLLWVLAMAVTATVASLGIGFVTRGGARRTQP
ncbi:MAG: TRAP transporter fused permease subunit [Pseudomonadota bacterium]